MDSLQIENTGKRTVEDIARYLFFAAGYKTQPQIIGGNLDEAENPEHNSYFLTLLQQDALTLKKGDDATSILEKSLFELQYTGTGNKDDRPSRVKVCVHNPNSKVTGEIVKNVQRIFEN